MSKATAARIVDLTPEQAFDLWTDTTRWPTFIDGFARVTRIDRNWPEQGSKIVWESVPTGRGTVTEKVRNSLRGQRIETQVLEERMAGTQTVQFAPAEEGPGTEVTVTLDYKLTQKGVFTRITDVLFIRGAQNSALTRTLRRFATEAAEEAAL